MKDFASLHSHSSYSQLDGASKIPELVSRAKELNMSSLGISDHGQLNGLIDFYKECKKQEIKPILGIEAYFTDDRLLKETVKQEGRNGEIDGSDKRYYHLSVYAQDNDGYNNLLKLSSDAFIEGYHYKPRADYSTLERFSKGLIVGSGCLGGPVLQPLLHGNVEAATRVAQRIQDIMGRDSFYIELMRHGLPEQARTNPQLIDIAKRIGAPIFATQDSHYTHKEDSHSHDSLLCQPPGTMVDVVEKGSSKGMPKGAWNPRKVTQKCIEDIVVGDRVASWKSIERRGKLVLDGNLVTKIGSRFYNDDMITVTTPSGASSSYTKDHICVARTDQDLTKGNFVVYLMRKGNSYRIGMTQYRKTYSSNTIGPVVRTKENNAEDVWILDVFQTRHEAAEEEQYLSWQYGIPTWSFPGQKKKEHEPRTPYYASLWDRVGDLSKPAKECLLAHGKMIEYPFFSQSEVRYNQRRPMTIRACNLEEGMHVCEPGQMNHDRVDTNDGSDAWQPISITRASYSGTVYSMDVDENHTYIADGIVTHNCCQTGSKLADENRFRFHGHEYYLKSPDQMYELFSDLPEACDNTLAIAEKCNVEIDFDTLHLPHFPIPEGYIDDVDYLADLTLKGIQKRYPNITDEVWDRVAYELSVIQSMGLASYFLICWDIIKFAKSQGILTGPGRGSSAGSIVCYALGVTKVDPLEYGLIFERFINPERIALADVDLDLASWGRDALINYTREKYGEEFVAQIVTFTRIKARTAVRDAARVLDLPPSLGDRVAKAMPPLIMGVDTPLSACFEYDPKFDAGYKNAQGLRDMYEKEPDIKRIVDIGLGLEGLVRGDGIHAAAVVIGDRPLNELVPLQRRREKGGELGPIVTQWEKNTIEELGLLKMDYLGLSNLDVITDCLKHMGKSLDYLDDIPMNDPAVFETLRRGEGVGLFQIESLPMRQLLVKLGPRNIDDISAVLALYRPGPMAANMHNDYADRRNDRQRVTYFHKDAEPILGKTQGLCVFQDTQVLTTSGPVAIKDIRVGDIVIGENSKSGRVVKHLKTGKKKMLRVSLSNGRQILCSEDHKFLTPDGYVEAKSIDGHLVATLSKEIEHGNVSDKDGAVILAGLIADGSLNGPTPVYTKNDPATRTHFLNAVKSRFPSIGPSVNFGTRAWVSHLGQKDRGLNGYHGENELTSWLRSLGIYGKKSQTKFIPSYVFKLDRESKLAFLGFYLSGDGHINLSGNTITYRTISEGIANGLHDLLVGFGIYSKVARDSAAFTVFIQDGKKFNELILPYVIGPKRLRQASLLSHRGFAPNILRQQWLDSGIGQREWAEKAGVARCSLNGNQKEYISRLIAERLGWESEHYWIMATVTGAGSGDMYDIEVEGTHSFVAESAVVHNCIFQEEVMEIARKFAGYSFPEADNLRKIMGKKLPEKMALEKNKFIQGCADTGYPELGEKLFDLIEAFASYAFNKSHSVGYSFITYWTAYLKTHYPREYMAALCTGVMDDLDKTAVYLNEVRRMGLKVYPPDINLSRTEYTIEEDGIRIGLHTLKNVGEALTIKIIEEREKKTYSSLYDFALRVNPNSQAFKSLAYSGALDAFGTRQGIGSVVDEILKSARSEAKKGNQESLFSAESIVDFKVPETEFQWHLLLNMEKETLGLYVSGHPLTDYPESRTNVTVDDIRNTLDEKSHKVLVIVNQIELKYTKKQEIMAIVNIEDQTGSIEVVMFPKQYAAAKDFLREGSVAHFWVRPGTDYRDQRNYIVGNVEPVQSKVAEATDQKFGIFLPKGFNSDPTKMARLKGIFLEHHGNVPVDVYISRSTVIKLDNTYLVDPTSSLKKAITDLFKQKEK